MRIPLIALALLLGITAGYSQDEQINSQSYKLLKLNLIEGLGVNIRHVNISYEQSLFKPKESHFSTLNVGLRSPFHQSNEYTFDWGLSAYLELRSYPLRSKEHKINGLFYGAGIMGGFTEYHRSLEYQHIDNWQIRRLYDFDYDRITAGVYGIVGTQAQLTDKIYFEMSLGIGLMHVNVDETTPDIDPNFFRDEWWWWDSGQFRSYQSGIYASPYVPLNINICYNLGTR